MDSLTSNDLRAACVELSRLMDPREASNGGTDAQGRAIELVMHIVEETAVNVKRIADALERLAPATAR